MAGRQLPNLLDSLRAGQGAARGRGRGRGGHHSGNRGLTKDEIVQRTDQDALLSRLSAVSLEYLEDPFARLFVDVEIPKRFPIINRGTYVRSVAIDRLVNTFLNDSPEEKKQIVSLGAGSDTRYFRLISSNSSLNLVYHELDFKDNTVPKVSTIQKNQSLFSTITSHGDNASNLRIDAEAGTITSPGYNLHAVDLRQFIDPSKASTLPNLLPDCPTLLLSECCLVYLPPAHVSSILTTFLQHIIPSPTPISLVLYEPIRPDDAFGRTMITNLENRGILMPTLPVFPSLASQRSRLLGAGFDGGQCSADIKFLWEQWVDEQEKERVASLEMMDEVEEWHLLAEHYCVAWGWRSGGSDDNAFSRSWGDLPSQQGK